MLKEKIFIDQEATTGDFIMRMPKHALSDLYEMIKSAPLVQRRTFFQVKKHLEDNYRELIIKKGGRV